MDRRRTKRTKRRLTCEFQIGDDRYRGIIRDISESGLFIQTTASARPGTVIDMRIGAAGDLPEMGVRAVVARVKRAPPQLATVVAAGLGVQILDAPDVYYRALIARERPAGRRAERAKQRLRCEFRIGGEHHEGTISDVSEMGLCIQTTASPPPGTAIDVRITASGDVPEMDLPAVVVRGFPPPEGPTDGVGGGIAVEIREAPEIYYTAVVAPQRRADRKPGVAAAPPRVDGRPFRVRVTQSEGARSRSLDVIAPSEEVARKEALAQVGEGWEVLEVTPG